VQLRTHPHEQFLFTITKNPGMAAVLLAKLTSKTTTMPSCEQSNCHTPASFAITSKNVCEESATLCLVGTAGIKILIKVLVNRQITEIFNYKS